MKILSRYLLRQHAVPFVFALTALTGFLLLNQVSRRIESLLGKGLPWTVIAEFFALTIPYLIAMTLSMAVLVAVLHAFSQMAGDREITAMRAGGVSLRQMLTPVLAGATVVAVVAFLFGDQVLPRTNHRLRTLMTDIARTKPTFSLKEHAINQVGDRRRYYLRATRIDPATYRMRDVTLYDLAEPTRSRIVYADSGYLAFTPNQEDLQLTLYEAIIHEFDRTSPNMFQTSDVERQVLVFRGIGREFVRREDDQYRGDRELGTCALDGRVQDARRDQHLAELRGEAARRNSIRVLVGLPEIQPDTTVPATRKSMYCRGLELLAGWLGPKQLIAQTPARDSVANRLRSSFNKPAQRVYPPGKLPSSRASEIRAFEDRSKAARLRAANYRVEFHKKYAIPAACITFVLIGAPIAMRFPGGGVGLVVGASMAIFGIYYVGLIAGESLANRLVVPPFVAMWASNLLFGIAGTIALWFAHRSGTGPA